MPDDGNFVATWLQIYGASRAENLEMIDSFARRIAADFGIPPGPSLSEGQEAPRRGWLAGSGRLSLGKLLREFFAQRRELRVFSRGIAPNARNLLVVSDTKRLETWADGSEMARTLQPLVETDGYNRFRTRLEQADALLVFTPNLFVGEGQAASRGALQIGYLGLLALLSLSPFATASRLVGRLRRWHGPKRFARRNLFWTLMSIAFDTLLEKAKVADCVMLTSNAFAVELLRWRAAAHAGTSGVFELLHGVPTREFLDYLDRLHAHVGKDAASKVMLIPSVPIDLSQAAGTGPAVDFAINAKLSAFRALNSRAELLSRSRPAGYRVAINGGVSDRLMYFDSQFFRIEREFVAAIRRFAAEHGVAIEILYSIHPAHLKSGIAGRFESELDVDAIVEDSIGTWVSSDLCIALVSSSIWEARYLGAGTFIAVSEADALYPQAFLEGIGYVRAGRDSLGGLREALERMIDSPPIGAAEVRRRIDRLYGPAQAGKPGRGRMARVAAGADR